MASTVFLVIAPLNSIIEDQFANLNSKGYRAATLSSQGTQVFNQEIHLKYKTCKTHLYCTRFACGSFTQSWHDVMLGIILHNLFYSNKEVRLLAKGNSQPPEAVYLKNKPRLVPVCGQAFSSPPLSPFSLWLTLLTNSFSQLCHSFLPSQLTRMPSYTGYVCFNSLAGAFQNWRDDLYSQS